jgi:hypothetical protein
VTDEPQTGARTCCPTEPGQPHTPECEEKWRSDKNFRAEDSDGDGSVWIESGLTDGGTYFIGFTCNGASWAFGRLDAQLYALGVLQLCQRAEYDSAVMRLFVNKLGMDLNTAGTFLAREFRKGRPDVKVADACRLGFRPGVSHRGLKPFLTVLLDDAPIGQWNLDAARDHALGVIELCEAVDLDEALKRVLTAGDEPIEESVALAAIHDLRNYRWKPGDDETEVISAFELASLMAGTDLPDDTRE